MKYLEFLSKYRTIAIIVGIVVVVGSVAYFTRSEPAAETLIVHPSDFVQQVSVSGKVTPAQEVDLGFTQSGRIASVRVSVGQRVSAGQVLAAVDNGDLSAAVQQKQAALDAQVAKLDALKQGTRPEEIAVAESSVVSNTVALAQSRQAVADAIENAYIKSDDAIRNKVYQFISSPRGFSPQLTFSTSDSQLALSVTSQISLIESELSAWQSEVQGTTADNALQYVERAQARLNMVSKYLSAASGAVSRGLPSSTISQSTLDGYSADVATGRTNVNTALSALTTAVTAQRSAAAALDSAQKTLALKRAGTVQSDIDAQVAQVKSAQADVTNAQAQLSRTLIIAPFNGIVTAVDAKVGMIVSPNTPQISMMSASAYQIESFIPEVNIAFVKPQNPADVTLDAYGDKEHFGAHVISVDPAETVRDGVSTYRALLEFDTTDPRIRSGMTANVSIVTDKRTGIISVPQGLVVEREGKKYVTVQTGDTTSEREVTTGLVSSLGTIEITSGLTDGDIVVIKPSA